MCFMILSKRIVHPVFTCILKHLSTGFYRNKPFVNCSVEVQQGGERQNCVEEKMKPHHIHLMFWLHFFHYHCYYHYHYRYHYITYTLCYMYHLDYIMGFKACQHHIHCANILDITYHFHTCHKDIVYISQREMCNVQIDQGSNRFACIWDPSILQMAFQSPLFVTNVKKKHISGHINVRQTQKANQNMMLTKNPYWKCDKLFTKRFVMFCLGD